jgi:tetratricopeptide (TPR) repeat protein
VAPAALAALLVALAAGGAAGGADGGGAAETFARANQHYQRGEFAAAEEIYRRLADAGVRSGEIYYNLGNACYKQKKLGEAIYFWEQARRRLPGDPEPRENLELANLLVVDRLEVPPDPWPVRLLDRAVHLVSVPTETRILVALWVALNLCFGLGRLARSARLRRSATAGVIACALLLAAGGASLGWKLYERAYRKEGVVIGAKVDVRSAPGRDNVTVFTVHEGIRVQVRGEAAGWYQVSLPNGWTGWAEKAAVAVL